MKISYACEICGNTFDSEAKAKACETEHENAAKQKEIDAQKEAKLLEALNNALNVYISIYHKPPTVSLTRENEIIVLANLEGLLSRLTNLFLN